MRRRVVAVYAATCALTFGCARGEPPAADAPPPSEAATPARSCFRLDLTPLKVVRVDEPQRRLFVAAPDAADAPIAARVHDLESCFGLTDWSGRWSLSVFTDAALARYKDDPQVADAVKDGRWARAYVAEYSALTKTLTRNPAVSPLPADVAIIERQLGGLRRVSRQLLGYSAEGGELTAYFDGTRLRKLQGEYYGESGRAVAEYYYGGDRLLFAKIVTESYDEPLSGRVVSTEEKQYVFDNPTADTREVIADAGELEACARGDEPACEAK